MDYPCDKFGDCSFNHFGFIMRTNKQNHTQRGQSNTETELHRDAAKRFTLATVVGISKTVSKYLFLSLSCTF